MRIADNVPDDWNNYWTRCGWCGGRYHASEGGCDCGTENHTSFGPCDTEAKLGGCSECERIAAEEDGDDEENRACISCPNTYVGEMRCPSCGSLGEPIG